MEQAELVELARAGDRGAFEALVRQTYTDTYTLAFRLTGNQEDAADVAQDAYLRAWRGIGKFRAEAQFSTWLYRITANVASTHTARRRRLATTPLDTVPEPVDLHAESRPDAMAESGESLERLALVVDALPAKLREVVVLKDVYGLSHEAIGEELGISVAAAKVRLHRARRKLKDAFYESGETAHAV